MSQILNEIRRDALLDAYHAIQAMIDRLPIQPGMRDDSSAGRRTRYFRRCYLDCLDVIKEIMAENTPPANPTCQCEHEEQQRRLYGKKQHD